MRPKDTGAQSVTLCMCMFNTSDSLKVKAIGLTMNCVMFGPLWQPHLELRSLLFSGAVNQKGRPQRAQAHLPKGKTPHFNPTLVDSCSMKYSTCRLFRIVVKAKTDLGHHYYALNNSDKPSFS